MSFDRDFFQKIGMNYSLVDGKKYASLNHVLNWADLGFNFSLSDLEKISTNLAETLNLANQNIYKNPEILGKMGYGYRFKNVSEKYILRKKYQPPFAMRLGYVVDECGNLHLIEVNSQTPTFWWECEAGKDLILKQNNLGGAENLEKKSCKNLQICLKNSLQNLAKSGQKDLQKLRVGLVCEDDDEDIFQMSFIKNEIEKLNLVAGAEVLTLERLDVDQQDNFYSLNSQENLDILFFWYPFEWLVGEEFADGLPFWDILIKSLEENKVILWNGLESFLMQNKYLLAYITENWEDFSKPEIFDAFTDTFYIHDDLAKIYQDSPWISKPIWGRQGLGVVGFDGVQDFAGKMDENYINQWYAYQPFYKSKSFNFEGKKYYFTLENWVYFDGQKYISGGVGLRANTGLITEDFSKWFVLK